MSGIKKKTNIGKEQEVLSNIGKVLEKAAAIGHSEECPLCGQMVLSKALHFVSCPVVEAERNKK